MQIIARIDNKKAMLETICMLWYQLLYPHDQSLGRRSGINTGSMSNEKKERRKKIFRNIESQHTI